MPPVARVLDWLPEFGSKRMSPFLALAQVFIADRWQVSRMLHHGRALFRQPPDCLEQIAVACRMRFADTPPLLDLVDFLEQNSRVQQLWKRAKARIDFPPLEVNIWQPSVGAPRQWNPPPLLNENDLCDWLQLTWPQLQWLAGLWPSSQNGSQHYHFSWVPKKQGQRLIEAPKAKLKRIQLKVLDDILSAVPIHESAHGFCVGRSVVTCVQPHVGKPFCLKMDLQHFFPCIPVGRIHHIFRTIGYPPKVALVLARLCTVCTPTAVLSASEQAIQRQKDREVFDRDDDSQVHSKNDGCEFPQMLQRHLPQGAPTSPSLANLAAFALDLRLEKFSRSQGIHYTRYADDLLFSGVCPRKTYWRWFHSVAAAIVIESGFAVNFRKTRWMPDAQRQSALGTVFNEKTNVRRHDFDRLKATLYNCIRQGPASQNVTGHSDFKSHLAGRIQWIKTLNPTKAQRLLAIFEKIQWQTTGSHGKQ